jgi:hypothetical protein
MVRELTLTNLEYSPAGLATGEGGTYVMLGASQGMPLSVVPRTVSFDPNPRIFGNCLDGCPRGGHPTVCLGLPCNV